jgi:hypothetical protein
VIIRVGENRPATLEDCENFKSFKAVCSSRGKTTSDALEHIGVLDGDHVWVDQQWIRRQGRDDAAWLNGLGNMIQYAKSAGWVDEAGRVRAHIELD